MVISKKRNALQMKKSKKKINSNTLKKCINKSKIRGGIGSNHSSSMRRRAAEREAAAEIEENKERLKKAALKNAEEQKKSRAEENYKASQLLKQKQKINFLKENNILLLNSHRKVKRLELLNEKSKELELHKMVEYLIHELVFSYMFEDILEIFSFYNDIDYDKFMNDMISLGLSSVNNVNEKTKKTLAYLEYIFLNADYTIDEEGNITQKNAFYSRYSSFHEESYLFNISVFLDTINLYIDNTQTNLNIDICIKLLNSIKYDRHPKHYETKLSFFKAKEIDINKWTIQQFIDLDLDKELKIMSIIENKKKKPVEKIKEYLMHLKPFPKNFWTRRATSVYDYFINTLKMSCQDLLDLGFNSDIILPTQCYTWTIVDLIERNYSKEFIFNFLYNHTYNHDELKDLIIDFINDISSLKVFTSYPVNIESLLEEKRLGNVQNNKMTLDNFEYIYKKVLIKLFKLYKNDKLNTSNLILNVMKNYNSWKNNNNGLFSTNRDPHANFFGKIFGLHEDSIASVDNKLYLDAILQIFKPYEIPYETLKEIIECPIEYKNDYVKFVIDTIKTSIMLPLKLNYFNYYNAILFDAFRGHECLLCSVPETQFSMHYMYFPPYNNFDFKGTDNLILRDIAKSLYWALGLPNKWKKNIKKKQFRFFGKETTKQILDEEKKNISINQLDEFKKKEFSRFVFTNLNINMLNLYEDYHFPYDELVKHKDDFIELQNHIYENRIYFSDDMNIPFKNSIERITYHNITPLTNYIQSLNEYHEKQNEFIKNKTDYVAEFFVKYPNSETTKY